MIEPMAETQNTPSKTPSKTTNATRPAPVATEDHTGPVDIVTGNPAADLPMDEGRIVPTPGDVATEPVAKADESHVAGRVGPRTIAEDATATGIVGGEHGIVEVMPGAILADTPEGPGRVPVLVGHVADPVGERLARITEAADRHQA